MNKAALVLLVALIPTLAQAQSVVCSGKIINEGSTKAEVLAACGKPMETGKDAHDPAIGKSAAPDSDEGTEVWTYNFGPGKFMQRIWFEGDRVRIVESPGYGH